MIGILSLLLFSFEGESTLNLENNGRYLGTFTQNNAHVLADGSYLLISPYRLYKFNSEGKLILEFGGRGDGPGEFVYAFSAVISEGRIVVLDVGRLMLNFFTLQGEYIDRHAAPYRQIYALGDRIYGSTLKEIMLGTAEPKSFVPLNWTDDQRLIAKGDPFHPFGKRLQDLEYNYKIFFPTFSGESIYLMDQISPQIYIYDAKTHERASVLPVRLLGFKSGPDKMISSVSQLEANRWQASWSRVEALQIYNGTIVISYSLPLEDDSEPLQEPPRNLAFFDLKGESVRDNLEFQGIFLGVSNDHIHFLDDDVPGEGDISYQIRKIPL